MVRGLMVVHVGSMSCKTDHLSITVLQPSMAKLPLHLGLMVVCIVQSACHRGQGTLSHPVTRKHLDADKRTATMNHSIRTARTNQEERGFRGKTSAHKRTCVSPSHQQKVPGSQPLQLVRPCQPPGGERCGPRLADRPERIYIYDPHGLIHTPLHPHSLPQASDVNVAVGLDEGAEGRVGGAPALHRHHLTAWGREGVSAGGRVGGEGRGGERGSCVSRSRRR